MADIILHTNDDEQSSIKVLEQEIICLEIELEQVEKELNIFEAQIRLQLQQQILRIRALTSLYKQQKQAKKAKRLEQKKRGKNYKQPTALTPIGPLAPAGPVLTSEKMQQLKRLFKEAIVLVHPDKFTQQGNAVTERAHALTIQLNALYKSENLDELSQFHEHIISGNAMSHIPFQPDTVANTKALLQYLQKKKSSLVQHLQEAKHSQTYVVLKTYPHPEQFIVELRDLFEQRIQLLEKRTRKATKDKV